MIKLVMPSSCFMQGFLLRVVDYLGYDSMAQGDFVSLKGVNCNFLTLLCVLLTLVYTIFGWFIFIAYDFPLLLSLDMFGLPSPGHPITTQMIFMEWEFSTLMELWRTESFQTLLKNPLHDSFRGMKPEWKMEAYQTIQKISFVSKFLSDKVSVEIQNLAELNRDLQQVIAEYDNPDNCRIPPPFPAYDFPNFGDTTSSNTVSSPEQGANMSAQECAASCNGFQGVKLSSPVVKDFTELLTFPGQVPMDVDCLTDPQDQETIDSLRRLSREGGVKLEGLNDTTGLVSCTIN